MRGWSNKILMYCILFCMLTEGQDKAFKELKSKLKSVPILATPDMSRNFIVHTDASEYAIGAVLLQENLNDNYPRIIVCASRTLQDVEKR
uniref:RT_RNaseH_2 domain-containing protein n=1 Tax=Strongyloides venezuelensis TaxID=75913 RepID=A0A0K0FSW2_STRVS